MSNGFPLIRNFYDVFAKSAELITAVEKNPSTDVIYFLQNPQPGKMNSEGKFIPFPAEIKCDRLNWCIAGSAALSQLSQALTLFAKKKKLVHAGNWKSYIVTQATGVQPGNLNPDDYLAFIMNSRERQSLSETGKQILIKNLTVQDPDLGFNPDSKTLLKNLIFGGTKKIFYGNFEPGDVDIFFLDSPFPHRLRLHGHDFVMTKAKTVEELLLNFDLPCCRAAYNVKRDYWVSAQCLYSMMMGRYPMPTYTTSLTLFTKMIVEHRNGNTLGKTEDFLFKRLEERTTKYKDRGFTPYYFETNQVLDWIKNRFHYGEWKK